MAVAAPYKLQSPQRSAAEEAERVSSPPNFEPGELSWLGILDMEALPRRLPTLRSHRL